MKSIYMFYCLWATGIARQNSVGSYWPTKQASLVQGESLPTKQGDLLDNLLHEMLLSKKTKFDGCFLKIIAN